MNLQPQEHFRVRLKSFTEMKGMDPLAIHESGHAVVQHVLGARVEPITIAYHSPNTIDVFGRLPDGNAGYVLANFTTIPKDRRTQSFIVAAWAGYEGEIWFGIDKGAMSLGDFHSIYKLYIRECELRNADEAEQTAIRHRFFGDMRKQARRMIGDHCELILAVYRELRVKRFLTREQFLAIVQRWGGQKLFDTTSAGGA